MKLEELEIKLAEIKAEAQKKRTEAIIAYCKANQKFKVGDIIEDHCHVIKVDSLHYSTGILSFSPETVYRGRRLRKSDLKPVKSGDIESVWESNVKKVHKKENS